MYESKHRLTSPTGRGRTRRLGPPAAAIAAALLGSLGWVTSLAVPASATTAPGLGAAFSCASSGIYGAAGTSIYAYPTSGIGGTSSVAGTASSTALAGASLNALGIAPGGTTAFAVDSSTKHVEKYDPVAQSWTDLGAVPGGIAAIKGAVDPLDGKFYFGDGNNTFYVYDPSTGAMSTTPLTVTGAPTGGNGDAAFNAKGDLYLVSTNALSFVGAAQLAAGGSVAATTVSSNVLSGTSGPNGISFTSDGRLYLSTSSNLYQINSATGAVVGSASPISQSVVDLATCQYPPTLQLRASVNSRESAADQFGLAITGGGLSAGNQATTSGSATGVQAQAAGPVPAVAGTTYTFTETAGNAGTSLASYQISASCVDTADGDAPIATTAVSSTSFTVNLPAAAGADGQAVVCTFDNASAPTITSPAFGGGEVGAGYSQAAAAAAGSTPYTWSVTGGTLPAGLSLDPSTGVLSGTPTTPGSFGFSVVVTDANSQTAAQAESVDIAPAPMITSAVLPNGEGGVAYSQTPAASGGTGPYTWSMTGGALPPGLSLDPSTGVVTGTPTATGSYGFTLMVTDANGQSATQLESIVISVPAITSAALVDGESGVAYSQAATASGGTGPYTWSVTGGTLPPGLSLDPSTGTVTGTPTASGSYVLTLVVTDANGQSATQDESVDIASAPALTSPALPGGQTGVAYSQTATASGGTGPYTWSVTGGTLPPGLSLDPSTGMISGTPTASGSYVFALVVTDANGQTATQDESVAFRTRATTSPTPAATTDPPAVNDPSPHAPASQPSPGRLSDTGVDVAGLAGIATGLSVLGGILLVATRRRVKREM